MSTDIRRFVKRYQRSINNPERPCGFSLIELVVALAIIALLAGLSYPAVSGAMAAGREARTRASFAGWELAAHRFRAERGAWPLPEAGVGGGVLQGTAAEVWIESLSGRGLTGGSMRQPAARAANPAGSRYHEFADVEVQGEPVVALRDAWGRVGIHWVVDRDGDGWIPGEDLAPWPAGERPAGLRRGMVFFILADARGGAVASWEE